MYVPLCYISHLFAVVFFFSFLFLLLAMKANDIRQQNSTQLGQLLVCDRAPDSVAGIHSVFLCGYHPPQCGAEPAIIHRSEVSVNGLAALGRCPVIIPHCSLHQVSALSGNTDSNRTIAIEPYPSNQSHRSEPVQSDARRKRDSGRTRKARQRDGLRAPA